MHWKRGFRRIAFVLAVVAAVICAGLSVIVVLSIHSSAQSNLEFEREKFATSIPLELEQEPAFQKLSSEGKKTAIEGYWKIHAPPIENKQKLEELENGFWVSLSKNGLAGICTLVGLVGGLTGFFAIWFIYKLLEWLVLGFCVGREENENT